MKLLLCADREVGTEIARFLIETYREDLALVVSMQENDIYSAAKSVGIPTLVFTNSNDLYARICDINLDLGVLAWWPIIMPQFLLEVPRNGFINTHPSLLPHNRGKHPNFWAIVEGAPFGVTLHFVDRGIDSGDILAQQEIAYDWCDNGGTLYKKAMIAIVELFRSTYPLLREGRITRRRQDLSVGSFHKAEELEKASHIDLHSIYCARDLLNLLRARTFEGYPSCWFEEDGHIYEVRVDIRKKGNE